MRQTADRQDDSRVRPLRYTSRPSLVSACRRPLRSLVVHFVSASGYETRMRTKDDPRDEEPRGGKDSERHEEAEILDPLWAAPYSRVPRNERSKRQGIGWKKRPPPS